MSTVKMENVIRKNKRAPFPVPWGQCLNLRSSHLSPGNNPDAVFTECMRLTGQLVCNNFLPGLLGVNPVKVYLTAPWPVGHLCIKAWQQ